MRLQLLMTRQHKSGEMAIWHRMLITYAIFYRLFFVHLLLLYFSFLGNLWNLDVYLFLHLKLKPRWSGFNKQFRFKKHNFICS